MTDIQAGPVRLEYFDVGAGERVVVLVHGASSSGRIWHTVQQELATAGMRSIAISLRGAGGSERSDREEDYQPSSYAADLARAVEALGLPPFVLFGHSLGTIVTAYYVRDHKDRVRTLIQMAGPPIITEAPAAPPQAAARGARLTGSRQPASERWREQHQGLPDDVREALRRDIENNPAARMRGQRPPWTGIDDVAANLEIPTLVVCGDADDVIQPRFPLAYYLALPEAVRHLHVFHGLGHFPNAQAPKELTNVIVSFIRERVAG